MKARNGAITSDDNRIFSLRGMKPASLFKCVARHVLLKGNRPERIISRITNAKYAMQRVHDRMVPVKTIIDVGASDGHWAEQAMKIWPDARCHLIEANPEHGPALKAFAETRPNVTYTLAAAGRETGEVLRFKAADDLYGGTLASGKLKANEHFIEVPVTSLDHEVAANNLHGPFLLKLDTHGFEVPILEGAREVLKNTSLAVIEVYVFTIAPESLKFHEMCAYMDKLGFSAIDFAEPLWRPYDKSLWQFDLLFVRKDRPEFSYNSYS